MFRAKTALVTVLVLLSCVSMQAQKADVFGTLVTGKANNPVSNANVLLVRMNGDKADSTYRLSTNSGTFTYRGLPPGKVYIKVTKMGMNPADGVFDLTEGDNAVLFTMTHSREELESSIITGSVPLVRLLGDTTVFNAAAVKTMPGETAMAILEQLPGFDINGNAIKYRGRKVSRTYVNGIQLFGDDATNAFRQLKAEEVTQIRTYEEQNAEDERRGLKNSHREQVIDVKTKDKIFSLTSIAAQMTAGADEAKMNDTAQARYLARAGFDFNSEMASSSVNLGADNLVSAVEGVKPGGVPGLTVSEFRPHQKYGENIWGQIWTERHWKDRRYGNGIGIGYAFSHEYSHRSDKEIADYYPTDVSSGRKSIDSTAIINTRTRHDFLVKGDFKDTPLKSIGVSIGGQIVNDKNHRYLTSDVTLPEKHMTQNSHTGSRKNDVNLEGSISWRNNDLGKIRPSFTLSGKFMDNNTLAWNTDTLASSYIRRNLQSDGLGKSWSGRASANLEIVLENSDKYTSKILVGAFAGNERSTKRNLTLDMIDPMAPVQDLANTYDFTWNTLSCGLNQEFTLSNRSTHIQLSLAETLSSQKDDEYLPSHSTYNHLYLGITPTFRYTKNMRSLTITAKPLIPSVEQTRNRISDANPLVLTGGNPDLHQAYTILLTYMDNLLMDKKSLFNIGLTLNAFCTLNPIVNRAYYFNEDTSLDSYNGYLARGGSILNTFSNASSPAYSMEGGLSFSKRFQKANLKSNLKISGGLESRPQYLFDELAHISMKKVSASLSEIFKPSNSFSLVFSASSAYTSASSDVSGPISKGFVNNASLQITYRFTSGYYINPKATVIWHQYLSGAGRNNLQIPASIEIGKTFKQNGLRISLGAYDLLNRGTSYSTSANVDSYIQKWAPSFGRYYLFNIECKFRKKR